MTAPAPEKAAPIPAEEREPFVIDENRRWIGVNATGLGGPEKVTRIQRVAEIWRDQGLSVTEWVRADREARPSLPDSREERIRAGAAEDERDRLLEAARAWHHQAETFLFDQGAMLPAERARARQGGNNG